MSTGMSPDDLLTADTQARQQALERASFIVEAPAGAGKTELLTQRFLALLPTVQDPEEIIALTFTNKAAAEMRSRIMDSLTLAARGARPGDELPHKQITFDLGRTVLALDAEREWGLMQHPGRLQITTLDALCGRLARQMPFLSRFGAQPTVSPDAQPLYRKAARNTLDMLEDEGSGAEGSAPDDNSPQVLLSRVLAYFDNDARKLQSLLEAMLATRDQWLGHLHGNSGPSPEALARLVEGELDTIATALPAPLQQAMMATARYAADRAQQVGGLDNIAALLDWASPLAPARDELPRWRGLGELLLTKTGTLRSRFDPALKLSEKDVKPLAEALKTTITQLKDSPTAEELLARISQLPDPQPPTEDRQLIADFSRLLVLASAQLWLVFLEERQVDFTEVAQNALAALGSSDAPSELRERLDYRISHLLVDEFQDTNPTQVRLLEQLTSDWQQGDGRTLFLVGDPMQSIYRFRKADVGLFLKVRQRGIGGLRLTSLRLYRNNRSHPELVDWVNDVFPQVFATEDDPRQGAVKFAPAAPTKASHPQAKVAIHVIVDSGDDGENGDEQASPADQREARHMVALLRQARKDDPNGSIAVLVRAKIHLQPLVAELRQAGPELAYQAVEIEALDQRQSIQDLLALTRALHHRADRVNWLAILRAPWCGLVLADLHTLAADDHRSTIWQLMQDDARLSRLSPDGQQRLGHVRSVLAEAYAHQGQHRPRRWVEGIWQALGGPRCLQDASAAQDVTAFFALLDSAEHKGSLDLDRLDEAMAKLFATPDPKGGAIQLMTVHKSKGLEFDTVLLPGLHRTLRGNDRGLLLWEEVLLDDVDGDSREHLIVAPLPHRKPAKGAPPSAYDYLQKFENRRSEHEGQRVLYVAVTRARRQLHLLAKVKPSDKEGEVCKAPAKNTTLAQLWPALGTQFEAEVASWVTQDKEQKTPKVGPTLPWLVRLVQPARNKSLVVQQGAIKEDAGNEGLLALEDNHTLDAHVGTLVHRYLELIAKEGLERWDKTDIKRLMPRLQDWLSQQGHSSGDCATGADKVARHLNITLQSEAGRWLLSPHPKACSELALTALHNNIPRVQVVDRSFIDQDIRWIVDYKTAEPSYEDEAIFIATQIELYQEQLSNYAALMSKTPESVRCALYFTGLGRLTWLS